MQPNEGQTYEGLISGHDAATLALIPDVSHWNGDIDLSKAGGVLAGLIIKASDGKQVREGNPQDLETYKDDWFNRNIQKAYDAHIPAVAYHYVQFNYPGYTKASIIDANVKAFKNALKGLVPGKSFHALALDVEQKDTSSTNAKEICEAIYNALKDDPALGGLPIFWYTSISVLNYYPALRDWLSYKGSDKLLWLAQWAYSPKYASTWANLTGNILPKLDMKVLTPGFADWTMLQFGVFNLPGNIWDMSVYHGTREQFYALLGYQGTTTTPDPGDPPTPPPSGEYVTRAEFEAFKAKLKAAL